MSGDTRQAVEQVRSGLVDVLREGERQRRELVNEVLKLAWAVGVPHDDAAVLEAAANLPVVDLVRVVGRWVDGAIERQAEKRQQALWMDAVVPQLMAELECMLRNDGEGERYDEREWRLARGEVQRLVQQLRDAGVEGMTMRGAEQAGAGGAA